MPQHYIFFFPDEMRASSLHCCGNPYAVTPNYDRLAAEGTLFEQNYTTHPVCVASRCSLMTGWYPHVNGYRTLRYFIDAKKPNFLRYLHNAGYEIHVYGKNHMFDEETYFSCIDKYLYVDFGHTTVKQYVGNVKGAETAGGNMNGGGRNHFGTVKDYTMLLPPMEDEELEGMNDTRCAMAAVDAIESWREGDKPLFIFLPTFYPHAPYTVPKRFYEMYDPETLPILPPDLQGKPELQSLIRQYRELGDTDEMVFKKIHAVYLGMVSYADMLLGRVLDALDRTGLAANTTVIAGSDHGDWAGDWGLVEKWPNAFDDDLTRVPLIIRRPGCPGGHRVKELTQTFDVFPTICGWEGIPVKHDQFGIPLCAQVAGEAGDPDRVVWCEGGYDVREPHCFEGTGGFSMFNKPGTIYYPKMTQQQKDPVSVCRGTMMRNARFKLNVRTSGDNELYDMIADPTELHNLYHDPAYADVVAAMEKEMLVWLMDTSDVVPREGHE